MTRASRFENAESISDQKYTQTAYIYFDKQMLNFLNSFKARLESVSNEMITPQEERVFDLVMMMVTHKKREMEQFMKRNSWFLRSGRWKKESFFSLGAMNLTAKNSHLNILFLSTYRKTPL